MINEFKLNVPPFPAFAWYPLSLAIAAVSRMGRIGGTMVQTPDLFMVTHCLARFDHMSLLLLLLAIWHLMNR